MFPNGFSIVIGHFVTLKLNLPATVRLALGDGGCLGSTIADEGWRTLE